MGARAWRMPWLTLYLYAMYVFLATPLVVVALVAFNPGSALRFPPTGLSLRWFVQIWETESFVTGIVNSLKLGGLATGMSMVLGVPAAIALGRGRFRGRESLETAVLSPLSLPMIVLGLGLLTASSAVGMGLSFPVLVGGHVVITLPYVVRTTLAVYRGLDPALEEAARVHGATAWRTFRLVTLPLLRPGLIAGGIFAFLISFDNVPVSIFLTRSDTTTLPVAILSYMAYNLDPSVAAISTLQMAVATVALLVLERMYGLQHLTAMGQQ